jgi:hypothetical protein
MSDNERYYDDIADAWDEQYGGRTNGGGGGAKKKKVPTTVGKQREGSGAWVSVAVKACPKGCRKKCCSGTRTTPSLTK